MGILKTWHRWMLSQSDVEAAELQADVNRVDLRSICECQHGEKVAITGTVRTMTIRPTSSIPALEIELYDGSGSVSVVWLGRRRIPGIETGRHMIVTGRLTCNPQESVMYNPRYELKPASK